MIGMRIARPVILCALALSVSTARAQKFSTVYNFGSGSGDPTQPDTPGMFAQGRDGNLYSTSTNGGAHGAGAVFRLTPAGTMSVVYSFTGNVNSGGDGGWPYSGLTLGIDGNLYGVTSRGGSSYYACGTVFKITTGGAYSIVHSFNCTTEGTPSTYTAAPIQGKDGNFYGTVWTGSWNAGTFYKMTPSGTMTVLYQFGINGSSLSHPGAVIQATDGNFYGACRGNANGAVFRITAAGKLTVLHAFTGADGTNPIGPIIQASDGNFYGTTLRGGSAGYGVVYKITPKGGFQVLFNFPGGIPGLFPVAGLVQATDGKLYGATSDGGSGWDGQGHCGAGLCPGALFQITSTGSGYTVVHSFLGSDGTHPQNSLFQHTNGAFYSDTYEGGTAGGCVGGCGTLYSLGMGLHPFVSLMMISGKAGQTVQILGQGLTGTTSVKFGSGAATFHVLSNTYMTTVVPATGTTGYVTLATPGGPLVSSKVFAITPIISGFSPASGAPGTQVVITGTGLTETTGVSFGGVAATSFTRSATQVTATVPAGAVTGKIKITTPGGIATSAATFTVI